MQGVAHKKGIEHRSMQIGAIVPWNYPFHNIFNPLLAALFAGNALVIKVFYLTGRLPRLSFKWHSK